MDEPQLSPRFDAAGRSDIGTASRRAGRGDEDSQCVRRLARQSEQGIEKWLCAVADGVGQRKGGSVASAQALNMLEDAMERYARWGEGYLAQFGDSVSGVDDYLRFVAQCVDQQLKQNAENNVSITGMATTLTAVFLEGQMAHLLHVGDSRAYRLAASGGVLTQLTRDDAPEGEAAAEFDPPPSRALGGFSEADDVHVSTIEITDGDILLLCSDGLWREVDDALIARALRASETSEIAVERLIRIANRKGGRGNIAAVAIRVGEPPVVADPELEREYPASAVQTERSPRGAAAPRAQAPPPPAPPPPVAEAPPAATPAVAEGLADDADAPADAAEPPVAGLEAPGPAPFDEAEVAPYPSGSPRSALSRSEAPGVPTSGSGTFALGMLAGVGLCLVAGGIWWAARALLTEREPSRPVAEVAVTSESEAEPVFYSVWLWERPIGKAPATVSFRKGRNSTTGEEEWFPMASQSAGSPPTPVTMFRGPDGIDLYLRIRYALDGQTREPTGDILTVKFVPEQQGATAVNARPGEEVSEDDPLTGVIEVVADKAMTVNLRAMRTSQQLLANGTESVQLRKGGDDAYHGSFGKVPRGEYQVSGGEQTRASQVSAERPRDSVDFREGAH